ncbi:MAG: HNH endonuclease [Verrucomicrobia bacterium]|nr:HNH endonuclease [Verrucomicrobiota bacterium]
MIRINKGDIPPILAANAVAWRDQLLGYLAARQSVPTTLATAYNHLEIKNALRNEARRKCMYCEGVVEDVAYEHIEHLRPKAPTKFPELTYEWGNLGLACPACNVSKGDDFDDNCAHIDPYNEDPADFFQGFGPMVFPRLGNARAELTAESVKLNRPGLMEQRAERLKGIQLLMRTYIAEANPAMKAIWKRRILEEIDQDREFSFCLREFVVAQLGIAFLN